MQSEKAIQWTHEWAHYDVAVIEVAAALTESGNTNEVAVAKQAFAIADALAREAHYRTPVRVYSSPLAWIREQHDAAEVAKKPLSSELSFLWRMASQGMQIDGTFWEMIKRIRDMPDATVAELGKLNGISEVDGLRSAIVHALEACSH